MPQVQRVLCVAHAGDALGCLALEALDLLRNQNTRIALETLQVDDELGSVPVSCVVFKAVTDERIVYRRPQVGETRFRGKCLRIVYDDLAEHAPSWAPRARLVVLVRNEQGYIDKHRDRFIRAVQQVFESKRVRRKINGASNFVLS